MTPKTFHAVGPLLYWADTYCTAIRNVTVNIVFSIYPGLQEGPFTFLLLYENVEMYRDICVRCGSVAEGFPPG